MSYSNSRILGEVPETPVSGFRNAIINGNFDIWQRGTSFSNPASGTYTADRWVPSYDGSGATRTLSRQTFTLGQTDVPGEPTYFFRYDQSVAGTSGTFNNIEQRIEGVRTYAGQQVTLSFYAKATASLTLPLIRLRQVFGTGGSPSAIVNTQLVASQVITTSWVKYTYTATLPSISGKTIGSDNTDWLGVLIILPINSALTLDLAQVQLEVGPVATPFERRPIGTELALCQRYYQQYQNPPARGVAGSASGINRVGFSLPVVMRIAPTASLSGSLNWFDGTGLVTISSFNATYSTPHSFEFDAITSSTATYRPIIIYIGGNTGTINLSAEL